MGDGDTMVLYSCRHSFSTDIFVVREWTILCRERRNLSTICFAAPKYAWHAAGHAWVDSWNTWSAGCRNQHQAILLVQSVPHTMMRRWHIHIFFPFSLLGYDGTVMMNAMKMPI